MSYLKIAVSGKLGVAIKKHPILYIKACTDDVSYVYLFCINELRCVSDVTVSGDVLDCNLKIFCKRLITVVDRLITGQMTRSFYFCVKFT